MVGRLYQNLLRNQRSLWLGLIAASTIASTAMPADAALLDWLFPRRRAAQRQYYVLPSGTTPTTAARYTANYGSWGPSTTPYAWYAPQTQYRSLWAQVPVTTYRPVGSNALQPCTAYTWQTQRVPVTAFQPVVGTVAAVPAPAASSCNCAGAATTAYYGSTTAYTGWQTVAPATGNLYAYSSASQFAPVTSSATPSAAVTAGYAPYGTSMGTGSTSVDYATATPWQPVGDTFATSAPTGGATGWQPYAGSVESGLPSPSAAQGSATPWQPADSGAGPTPADQSPTMNRPIYEPADGSSFHNGVPSSSATQGSATPWQPVDSGAEPTPADQSPTLNRPIYEPPTDSGREPNGSRIESQRPEVDDRWNNYEDGGGEDAGGSTTRTGHFRPRLPNSNERFVPFQRPIPDPDDDYNWDFDDKFRQRDRPQRSARRSDARWEAIPVSATFTPEPSRRVRSQQDRSRAPADDLLPPARPRRPGNEGGWRSLTR